jgi:rSAM/selenodomain-associated transferase 1
VNRAILLFAKAPIPGLVKTRLAATLGAREAAGIYIKLAEAVCRRLPPDAAIRVLFDPPDSAAAMTQWLRPLLPPTAAFFPQMTGDLGARLAAGFQEAFAAGFDRVAAIGSDCVEITPELIHQALSEVERCDAVIGPTTDGGYYLLALKLPHPGLFAGVPWSTAGVLDATVANARELGLSTALLPMLRDVDTESDWRAAAAHLALARDD